MVFENQHYRENFKRIKKIIVNKMKTYNYDVLLSKINNLTGKIKRDANFINKSKYSLFLRYFKNNEEGIKNYYKHYDPRSSTEGQISKYIKSVLGYKKRFLVAII